MALSPGDICTLQYLITGETYCALQAVPLLREEWQPVVREKAQLRESNGI